MIGVDPAKRSHAMAVLDECEEQLAALEVGNDSAGYRAMLALAKRWPNRTWAVEGAGGVGVQLAQRLVADGETVIDVPPKLSTRARIFDRGHGRKNDCPPTSRRWPHRSIRAGKVRAVEDEAQVCEACGRRFSVECGITTVDLAGETFDRIPLGRETADWWMGRQPDTECHDCSAATGQRHHVGCDMEQCPRCGDQALTCECPDV